MTELKILAGRLRNRLRDVRRSSAVSACLLVLLTLPWAWYLLSGKSMIFGIPQPYFVSLFAVPVLMLVVLLIFANLAEDSDRHNLEFEDE